MSNGRGDVWDFDRGPAKGSGWPELFAATPNYRGLGDVVVGRDVFRWPTGPMFYRGRLDGSARVMIVGQEGAQDESLSHRSFTGGTGGHMQNVLRYLGLDRSYVFVNTFVYPIHKQYTPDLHALAQDPASPVVVHRHRIFDKLESESDLRLVIAVGKAAKESVATWIEAHGGTADPGELHLADGGDLSNDLRFIGVVHPGAAKAGGLAKVKADFVRATDKIRTLITGDPAWLPADPGVSRDLSAPFVYRDEPIPHRDFPFGTTPRLGNGSTSSNRKDTKDRSIQLFGEDGIYNAKGESLEYSFTAEGTNDGYSQENGDIAVEPPRTKPREYDPGPSATMARLLLGAASGLPWPDFSALGVTADPSFGVGPTYRGRFTNLLLVVLVDPDSQDDLFTGRALTGDAGQFFQQFLDAAGVPTRYLIVRTVPVDTSDLSAAARDKLVDDPDVRAIHREILRRVTTANAGVAAVIAMGRGARRLAPHVVPAGVPTVELAARRESGVTASWKAGLADLEALGYTPEVAGPTFTLPTGRGQIPRRDLPYGAPRWLGTSGDRASRPTDNKTGKPARSYVKLYLPTWVLQTTSPPLSPSEQTAANQL